MSVVSFTKNLAINFEVDATIDETKLKWDGTVTKIKHYGSHVEFFIESISNMTAIAGRYSTGTFLCVPRLGIALALAEPENVFHGVNKINELRLDNSIDALTAIYALKSIFEQGYFAH